MNLPLHAINLLCAHPRQVESGTSYPVRQATAHPVHENWRCTAFCRLLALPQGDPDQLRMLGELMLQVGIALWV